MIWVKENATVGHGSDSLSAQAQFLTGEFTSAGDIDAPLGRRNAVAATGVFCEAQAVPGAAGRLARYGA